MPHKLSPYRPRYIRPQGLLQIGSWKIKRYSLTRDEKTVDSKYLERAARLFEQVIADAPRNVSTYESGYVIVHDCCSIVFILVDYYRNENELVRHLYSMDKSRDGEVTYHTPSGLSACVWEGEIIDFERRKWMEHVVKPADRPDFGLYLESFATGEV